MKKQLSVLYGVCSNVKYLLCDEATSALDPTTTASILDLLKEINEKMGVTIEEIMEANIEKLRRRYPEGFSYEKALHRQEGDV